MQTLSTTTQPRTLEAPAEAFHSFSDSACVEICSYVAELDRSHPQGRVDDIDVDLSRCPNLWAEVEATRGVIDNTAHFIIYDRVAGIESLRGQAIYAWLLGTALGTPMIQNTDGWRMVEVYDRGSRRTIEAGARYHQTKQGAYMHNDAVNDVDSIDYLLLSCAQPAYIGGESILVDADSAHQILLQHPEVLEVLMEEFWFEKRGMSNTVDFFASPIIRYSHDGKALVRYFRTYIEGAHEKIGKPLTGRQVAALDFFDAVLDQSSVQTRVLLGRGQTLVSADDRFLHTRTAFVDRHAPREIDMVTDRPDEVNRYMLRMWSRK
ncbi:TauD/TfdA family dioxygenase [Streptomyces sp. NPDC003952]